MPIPKSGDTGFKPANPCCPNGHTHWVVQQKNNNTCGAMALRMAIFELANFVMGLEQRTASADDLKTQRGSGSNPAGWQERELFEMVEMHVPGMKLEPAVKQAAFGTALRALKYPMIAHCMAKSDKKAKGGPLEYAGQHWVVIASRNKKLLGCDTFCVLDSASGQVHTVEIDKQGDGNFQFKDHNGFTWKVYLMAGYRFVDNP